MESARSETTQLVPTSNYFNSSNTVTKTFSSLSSALLMSSANMKTSTKSSLSVETHPTSTFITTGTSIQTSILRHSSTAQSYMTSGYSTTKENTTSSEFKTSTNTGNFITSLFSSNNDISSNNEKSKTSSFSSVLPRSASPYWYSTNIRTSIKSSVPVETHVSSAFITINTSRQPAVSKYSSNMQSKETSRHSSVSLYLKSSMITKESSATSEFKSLTSIGNLKTTVFSSNKVISRNTASRRTSLFSSALPKLTSSYWSNENIRSSIKSFISVATHKTSSIITTITSLQTDISKYSSNIQSRKISEHSPVSSYLQSSMITKKNSITSEFKRSTNIRNRKTSVFLSTIGISSNAVRSKTSSSSSFIPSFTLSYWSNANIRSSVKSSAKAKTQAASSFITTITSLWTSLLKYSSIMQSKETSRHSPMSSYLQSSVITKENTTNSVFRISTSIENLKTNVFPSNKTISSYSVSRRASSFFSALPTLTSSYWSNANITSSINSSDSVATHSAFSFFTTIASLQAALSKYSSYVQSKDISRHSPVSSYLQSSMITKDNSTTFEFKGSNTIRNRETSVFLSNIVISSNGVNSKRSSSSSVLSSFTVSYWSNANIRSSIKSSTSVETQATSSFITTSTSLWIAVLIYSSTIQGKETSRHSPISPYLQSSMITKENSTNSAFRRSTSIGNLKTSVFSSNKVNSSKTASRRTSAFSSALPRLTSSCWSNGSIRSKIKPSAPVGGNATSSLFTFSMITIFTSFPLTESKYSSIMQSKETSKYSPVTSYLDSSLLMKKSTTIFKHRRSVSIKNFETSVLASNNFTASNTRTRKALSLSSVSPSFTSAKKSFINIKSSIKQSGSVVKHGYATFITIGTLISTTKSKYNSNVQSKETLIYSPVTAYLNTSREKKEKITAQKSKESRTILKFKTSKLASNIFISNITANSKVKEKSSTKFTYRMSYISSAILKNLTIEIKSSLSSVTRRSDKTILMASNQTILKTISHSTTQLINNVTSYYDTSLSHIGASSLSLKKFSSITTTGHAKPHSRSLEATIIGKNFSIVSKYSFLNLSSVTSTTKSILQISTLDKVPYATTKLETSIYSSVGLIKMSSQKSSLKILPSASKHKSEIFSTHFGLKKTLTSEMFTTSSSYNSALLSIGKTNTPLLETVSTDSFYQKSSIGLRKSSSNLVFSITIGNLLSTDRLLYSIHSLLRTSIDYFTSSFENFPKYTSTITVSLKRTSRRFATWPSKSTSVPVINSVSTKISFDFSLSMTISRQIVTSSSGSRSSPMTVVEKSLLSSYMQGSSTSKPTQVASAIPETKRLSSINFLPSATFFSSVMLSTSKLVSTKSYIVLSSNIAVNTYSVIVPSSTTTTKINSKLNFAKSITVNNSFKQSFATLSATNTNINRTAAKTEVLSEGYTSIKTHPTPFSTLAQILLTTTLIQASINIEISPTASLSLQATSSVISKPAKEDEIKFKAKIRLLSKPFNEDLKKKSSDEFKELEKAVREALTFLYQKLKGFVEVVIISFEAGSVITNYEIIIDKKESKTKNVKSIEDTIINITQNELNTGKLGNFTVSSSFNITLSESVNPQKKVKFPGWAIALIVIVILVIIAFIVVATQRVSSFSIKILLAVSIMFNCSFGQEHFSQAFKSLIVLNYLENLFDKSNSKKNFSRATLDKCFLLCKINSIMSKVCKMIKHTLKFLQQLLQDFSVYVIILWTLGCIRLRTALLIVDLNV